MRWMVSFVIGSVIVKNCQGDDSPGAVVCATAAEPAMPVIARKSHAANP